MAGIKNFFQNKNMDPSKSGLFTLVIRVLSALLQFPAIILLNKAWSSEQMGIWLLVSSLSQVILTIADFGLGQSLRLSFSRSKKLANTPAGMETVNAGVSLSLILVSVLAIIFIFFTSLFNLENIFIITNQELKNNFKPLFITFIVLNIISVPNVIISQLYFAFHEAEKTAMYDFLRAIVIFSLATSATSQNFDFVFLLIAASAAISRIIQTLTFYRKRKWKFIFVPVKKAIVIIKPYLIKSVEFWVLATLAMIQVALMPWLIARVVSVSQLGEFSLLIQLTGILLTFHLSYFMPLQSRYSDVTILEARFYLKRSLKITTFSMPILLLMSFLALPVLEKIINKTTVFEPKVLVFFGIWGFLWAIINTTSIMLNGFGKIRIQILGLLIAGLLPYIAFHLKMMTNLDSLFIFIMLGVFLLSISNFVSTQRLLKSDNNFGETFFRKINKL